MVRIWVGTLLCTFDFCVLTFDLFFPSCPAPSPSLTDPRLPLVLLFGAR